MIRTALLIISTLTLSSIFAAANDESGSAEQKSLQIWQKIVDTAYKSQLPEIVSPSKWDSLNLLDAEYDSKAFSHHGDVMIQGRSKLIHGFGTSAQVSFVPNKYAPFTGLLKGAEYGLLRISLAVAPSSDSPSKIVPGFALKFFVDGQASLNLMAMPSLDGQTEQNIFAFPYQTSVEKPSWSFSTWLIEQRFTSALSFVNQSEGNPRSLALKHLASRTQAGEKVSRPFAPFSLVFVASPLLNQLYEERTENEFRAALEGRGDGLTLFDVYAMISTDSEPFSVGKLVARSNFVASSYADQQLFFKHPPVHTWKESQSEFPEL